METWRHKNSVIPSRCREPCTSEKPATHGAGGADALRPRHLDDALTSIAVVSSRGDRSLFSHVDLHAVATALTRCARRTHASPHTARARPRTPGPIAPTARRLESTHFCVRTPCVQVSEHYA